MFGKHKRGNMTENEKFITLSVSCCRRGSANSEMFSRRRDSCSDNFFLSRSMTFEPLLALCNHNRRKPFKTTHLCRKPWKQTTDVAPRTWKWIFNFIFSFLHSLNSFYWKNAIWTPSALSLCIHFTFSLSGISLRRCEILTFMASSSSSGTWGDGEWFGLLWTLEGQFSQWDVPLAVVLLAFSGSGKRRRGKMRGGCVRRDE